MTECLILGDSIAIGTHNYRPECALYATSGITSRAWVHRYANADLTAKTAIISLGSNDPGYGSRKDLEAIRSRVQADTVFWILPTIHPQVQELVKGVAAEYGDKIVYIAGIQKDGVHPNATGYKTIAKETR